MENRSDAPANLQLWTPRPFPEHLKTLNPTNSISVVAISVFYGSYLCICLNPTVLIKGKNRRL